MKKMDFRRQGILLAVVLVMSLSVWLINWARTPELDTERFPGDGRPVPRSQWQLYNYREKGEALMVEEEGPYILLKGLKGEIQSVSVRLGSQLPPRTVIKLHYPDASGELSHDRMEEKESNEGMLEYLFRLPPKEYSFLRLSIPADFVPKEILVSESPVESLTHVIPPFRARDLAIPFLALLALGELVLRFWPGISSRLQDLWGRKRLLGLKLLELAAAGTAAGLLAWPLCCFRGIPYTWQHMAYFFLLGAMACGLWLLRGQAEAHPQWVFALLSLTVGLMIITASPLTAYIPGDGGIHYRHALSLSYGGEAYITKAERSLMGLIDFPAYASNEYNGIYFQHMRSYVLEGALYIMEESPLSFPSPLYAPGALGLWLGRFFGMHFVVGYALGRIVNLMAYTMLISFTIKLARRGRVLLCVTGLMPSALFQASTYSPGGIAMALAMLYTVLLFRLPEKDKSLRAMLIKSGLIVAIVLAAFMTPAVSMGKGLALTAGDQLAGLLSDPLGTLKIFARFILRDLPASGFLTQMGSFPRLVVSAPGAMVFMAALGITALTEPEEEPLPEKGSITLKAGLLAGLCFAAGVLILCASLVLTPVNEGKISGFQGRWLLPVLFPLLYILRLPQIKSTFHKGRYLYAMVGPAALITVMQLWRILRCYR